MLTRWNAASKAGLIARGVAAAALIAICLNGTSEAATFNLACKTAETRGDATPREHSFVLEVNTDSQTITFIAANGARGTPYHAELTDTAISWNESSTVARDTVTISRLTGAFREDMYWYNAAGDPNSVYEGTCTRSAQQF